MLHALTADAVRSDLTSWKSRNAVLYARFQQILADLRAAEPPDLSMLSVALRELRNLTSR
jgi:NAD-specific glutamate dehydrogenase